MRASASWRRATSSSSSPALAQLELVDDAARQHRERLARNRPQAARPRVDHAQRPHRLAARHHQRHAGIEAHARLAAHQRVVGEARVGGGVLDLEEALAQQRMRAEAHRARGRLQFGAHMRLEPLPVRIHQADHPHRHPGDACGETGDRVQRRLGRGVEHLQLLQPAAAARFVERQRRHPARELGEQQPGVLGLVEEDIGPRLPAQRLPGIGRAAAQHHHARREAGGGAHPAQHVEPAALREGEIEQHGVGALRLDQRAGLVLAGGGADHAQLGMLGEQPDQVVPQERGVFDDDDAHDGGSRWGSNAIHVPHPQPAPPAAPRRCRGRRPADHDVGRRPTKGRECRRRPRVPPRRRLSHATSPALALSPPDPPARARNSSAPSPPCWRARSCR